MYYQADSAVITISYEIKLHSCIRHGYARWQYIIEDEEAGIIDCVRKELNIPSVSPFPGSASTNENANAAQPPNANPDVNVSLYTLKSCSN